MDQHFVCDGNHFLVMHHQVDIDIDNDILIIWENVFNNFRNCYPEQNVQTPVSSHCSSISQAVNIKLPVSHLCRAGWDFNGEPRKHNASPGDISISVHRIL